MPLFGEIKRTYSKKQIGSFDSKNVGQSDLIKNVNQNRKLVLDATLDDSYWKDSFDKLKDECGTKPNKKLKTKKVVNARYNRDSSFRQLSKIIRKDRKKVTKPNYFGNEFLKPNLIKQTKRKKRKPEQQVIGDAVVSTPVGGKKAKLASNLSFGVSPIPVRSALKDIRMVEKSSIWEPAFPDLNKTVTAKVKRKPLFSCKTGTKTLKTNTTPGRHRRIDLDVRNPEVQEIINSLSSTVCSFEKSNLTARSLCQILEKTNPEAIINLALLPKDSYHEMLRSIFSLRVNNQNSILEGRNGNVSKQTSNNNGCKSVQDLFSSRNNTGISFEASSMLPPTIDGDSSFRLVNSNISINKASKTDQFSTFQSNIRHSLAKSIDVTSSDVNHINESHSRINNSNISKSNSSSTSSVFYGFPENISNDLVIGLNPITEEAQSLKASEKSFVSHITHRKSRKSRSDSKHDYNYDVNGIRNYKSDSNNIVPVMELQEIINISDAEPMNGFEEICETPTSMLDLSFDNKNVRISDAIDITSHTIEIDVMSFNDTVEENFNSFKTIDDKINNSLNTSPKMDVQLDESVISHITYRKSNRRTRQGTKINSDTIIHNGFENIVQSIDKSISNTEHDTQKDETSKTANTINGFNTTLNDSKDKKETLEISHAVDAVLGSNDITEGIVDLTEDNKSVDYMSKTLIETSVAEEAILNIELSSNSVPCVSTSVRYTHLPTIPEASELNDDTQTRATRHSDITLGVVDLTETENDKSVDYLRKTMLTNEVPQIENKNNNVTNDRLVRSRTQSHSSSDNSFVPETSNNITLRRSRRTTKNVSNVLTEIPNGTVTSSLRNKLPEKRKKAVQFEETTTNTVSTVCNALQPKRKTVAFKENSEMIENNNEQHQMPQLSIVLKSGKWRRTIADWKRRTQNNLSTMSSGTNSTINTTRVSGIRKSSGLLLRNVLPIQEEDDEEELSFERDVVDGNGDTPELVLEPTTDETCNLSALSLRDETEEESEQEYQSVQERPSRSIVRRSHSYIDEGHYRQALHQRQLSGRLRKTSVYERPTSFIYDHQYHHLHRPTNGLILPQLSARDVVLRRCKQSEPLPFEQLYSAQALRKCHKIGEGVYSEVFMNKTQNRPIVLKIIPVEGAQLINGEIQKKFDEILAEIVIACELTALSRGEQYMTNGFVEAVNVHCVQGRYPEHLIDLWDLYNENHPSENDHPEIFDDDQLFIVFEQAYGGQDLEAFQFDNALQSHSAFLQVALTLAIAEKRLEFEHRDLHWGNILLSRTEDKTIKFKIDGETITVPTYGIQATIIDFTLSRMVHNGRRLYNDLANDNELFASTGDYQFDIYRLMKDRLDNCWEKFEPYTNILWLHYVVDKMINGARYKNSKTRKHRTAIDQLMHLRDELLNFKSTVDFVQCMNENITE